MLRILLFCHVNIFIQNFIQSFGVYLYRYILCYIWLDYHYGTVTMLCSLKKCYITIPTGLPILATYLQARATFFCPQGGPLCPIERESGS